MNSAKFKSQQFPSVSFPQSLPLLMPGIILCKIFIHHQHKLQRVKAILGITSRSRMQQPIASSTRAQDGLDPLQLALVVVFILPSISEKTSLALASELVHLLMCTQDLPCCHHPLKLTQVVFFPVPTRHLLTCIHAHEHICNLHCVGVVVVCFVLFCFVTLILTGEAFSLKATLSDT